MFGYLGHVTVGLMDNIFVGKLNPINLAAVSLANSGIFFIMSFGIGFSYAITPLVSEAMGSGDEKRMRQVLYNGLLLNSLIGVAMAILTFFIPYFMRIAGQPEEVIALAVPYVRIVGVSLFFVMLFQAFKQFSDGMALTAYPMTATLIANLLNVGISYVLIFGKIGFSPYGIYGAAYGTLIARILTVGIIIWFMRYMSKTAKYLKGMKRHLLSTAVMKKILYLGVPSAYQGVFEMGIFSATVWIAGSLGAVPQAANQIALQTASLTFMAFVGFGVAATVRVGNQKGRKDYPELKRVAGMIFKQVFVVGLFFTLLLMLFRYRIPHWFLADYSDVEMKEKGEDIYRIAVHLIAVVSVFQISDGFQVTIQGALRGLQDVVYPFYFTFIAYWVIGFPVSLLLSRNYGAVGIWYGLLVGLTASAVMLALRFRYITDKQLRLACS